MGRLALLSTATKSFRGISSNQEMTESSSVFTGPLSRPDGLLGQRMPGGTSVR